MKICHLTSAHPYNDIRISLKECYSLVKDDYEVHLVAPNTEVEKFKGIRVYGKTNPYKGRIKRFAMFTKDIMNKALEIDADIYHFHDPELIPVGLKLIKYGKKVIYDVHEDVPRAILSKYWIPKFLRKSISFLFEKYENNSAKRFDYIVGATPFITNRFRNINKNTININNYPFLNELSSGTNREIDKEKKVCYIGGITPIRGIENIIKASRNIAGDVILAGSNKDNNLKKLMDESDVKYLGEIEREEVNMLLNESIAGLVLFLPEPNHINAQPNKMFEYMSAGIPVIASDFSLWKKVIEGNDCGICVDPLDVNKISEAIQWVLDNPERAAEMGRNGRKAVVNKFNWETESKKLINMYETLS